MEGRRKVVWKGDMNQEEGGMEGRHEPGGGWYGRET